MLQTHPELTAFYSIKFTLCAAVRVSSSSSRAWTFDLTHTELFPAGRVSVSIDDSARRGSDRWAWQLCDSWSGLKTADDVCRFSFISQIKTCLSVLWGQRQNDVLESYLEKSHLRLWDEGKKLFSPFKVWWDKTWSISWFVATCMNSGCSSDTSSPIYNTKYLN